MNSWLQALYDGKEIIVVSRKNTGESAHVYWMTGDTLYAFTRSFGVSELTHTTPEYIAGLIAKADSSGTHHVYCRG